MVDGQLVRSRWIIGADGQNSYVRRWANLDDYRSYKRRFGFRRHYRIAPWSDCVEIYWGTGCQFYITPVSPQEVCVVLISSDRHLRLDRALSGFPELMDRLEGAVPTSYERGAISVSSSFTSVVRGRVALIGDASGSVDAITGEGLCLAFQQAIALADALESGNLGAYQAEHRHLMRRPSMMASLMLVLDKLPRIRGRTLRALAANPAIFSTLLASHVGARSPAGCVIRGAVPLGWRMLTAGHSQGGKCLETF
jgi:flavin-dependent dehydrogenase